MKAPPETPDGGCKDDSFQHMLLITSDAVKALGAKPFHFHHRAEPRSFLSTLDLSKVGLSGPAHIPAARAYSGVACLSKGTIPRELNWAAKSQYRTNPQLLPLPSKWKAKLP